MDTTRTLLRGGGTCDRVGDETMWVSKHVGMRVSRHSNNL